jgi:hypothetical protein
MKKIIGVLSLVFVLGACKNNKADQAQVIVVKDTIYANSAATDKPRAVASQPRKTSSGSTTYSSSSNQSTSSNAAKSTEKKGLSHAARGAIVGAATGAATGAIVNKEHRGTGAAVGAAIGVASGFLIGKAVDKKKEKQ